MFRKGATIVWCILFIALLVHALTVSRGAVGLAARLGSAPRAIGSDDPFKFAVLGDVHGHRRSLRDALQKAASRGCAFVVQLGDFVDHDDDHEYRRFVRLTQDLVDDVPLMLVRGNHETMTPDGAFSDLYLRHISAPYYSFEYAGQLFCVFDNSSGLIEPRQFSAMRTAIERFRSVRPEGHVFAFLHMPPDLPTFNSPDLGDGASADLLALAADHRVDFIFAGHLHDYREFRVGPTAVIISGCGGGSIPRPSTDVHYVEVAISATGVTTERVGIARDSPPVAIAAYGLSVLIPRYRWQFVVGILVLLAWELAGSAYRRRRERRKQIQTIQTTSTESQHP